MKKWTRRDLMAATAAAMAGCGKKSAPSKLEVVRVNSTVLPSAAAFHLAMESGYFRDQGIEIENRTSDRGAVSTFPLLAGGKVDVSFNALTAAILNAVAKGGHVRVVAGREFISANCGDTSSIYGNRKYFPNGLTDLRDLKGKRMAIGLRAGTQAFAADVLLDSVGLTLKDIEPVYLLQPEAIAAVTSGQIHAMMAQVFSGPRLDKRFPELVRHPGLSQVLPDFQYSFVFFGAKMLAGPVETGGRFLAAYLRATREYLAGKTPRFLDEYAKSMNIDPAGDADRMPDNLYARLLHPNGQHPVLRELGFEAGILSGAGDGRAGGGFAVSERSADTLVPGLTRRALALLGGARRFSLF